jgi:hypothetical protein
VPATAFAKVHVVVFPASALCVNGADDGPYWTTYLTTSVSGFRSHATVICAAPAWSTAIRTKTIADSSAGRILLT